MGDNGYRPQGSEKIQNPDEKLARIREIAGIKPKPVLTEEQHRLNTKNSTVLHEATAADGKTYGLVQEGPKVYLKRLVNDHYEYLTGDEKDYAYKNFAEGFKHMNLLFKDISEQKQYAKSINLYEGGLDEKKNLTERFVLKTPQAQPPVSQDATPAPPPAEGMPPTGGDQPPAPDANPQASAELDQEFAAADGQADAQDPAKAMQKMTGKLTQLMRTADPKIMTSDFQKSIMNSVISALKMDQMEDGDVLSIIKKLKGEGNPEQAGDEAQPSGESAEFQNAEGNDYNVNNPANSEAQEPPLKEVHPLAGVLDGAEDAPPFHPVPPEQRGINRAVKEQENTPTADDGVMQNIVQQIADNNGFEINEANLEDLKQAVAYFVKTYGGDQNQTDFMKQLQEFSQDADQSIASRMSYSQLSPMGQKVFDDLQELDPSMDGLASGIQQPNDGNAAKHTNLSTPTPSSPALSYSMNEETTTYLHNTIMEALKKN